MTVAEAQGALYTRFFQLKVARVIVAQLLKAVASMHARSCIHADLHLGNVFLEFQKTISEMPSDRLFETLGSPLLEPVRIIGNEKEQPLPAGIPSHIVIPAWFGAKSEDIKLHEASVILTDFGEAFTPLTQQRLHSNTPLSVRPPETRFALERPLSFSADIWTLTSSIWTILRQRLLVDIFTSQENRWTPWGDCPRSRRHDVKTSHGIPTAKMLFFFLLVECSSGVLSLGHPFQYHLQWKIPQGTFVSR